MRKFDIWQWLISRSGWPGVSGQYSKCGNCCKDALKAMHCVENKREMKDLMKSSRPVIKRVEALFCTKDFSRVKESRACTMWNQQKKVFKDIMIMITMGFCREVWMDMIIWQTSIDNEHIYRPLWNMFLLCLIKKIYDEKINNCASQRDDKIVILETKC